MFKLLEKKPNRIACCKKLIPGSNGPSTKPVCYRKEKNRLAEYFYLIINIIHIIFIRIKPTRYSVNVT